MDVRKIVCFAVAGATIATIATMRLEAQEGNLPDQSLSDYRIGSAVRGEERKLEELEGKVVVIEYWGTR